MSNEAKVLYHKVTTDSFVRFFIVLFGVFLIWMLRDLIVSVLVSVVIASAISPLASRLNKFYIPRALTVFVVLATMIALFVSIFILIVPLIYDEFASFAKSFYVFQRDAINFISSYTGNKQLISDVIREWSLEDIQSAVLAAVTAGTSGLTSTASAVTFFITQTIIIFVVSFYLAVQEKGVERFLRVITPTRREDYVINLWDRSQKKIAAWAKGQLILALMIGATIYVGLTFIGVENPLLFAMLAAVGEVIPLIGMMIASLVTILFALVSSGASMAVVVAVFYFVVTQFENHILSPVIVNKVVGIPSVIVILALVVGGVLAGFWGVLLAVPVASVIMEFVSDIEHRKRKQLEEIASKS